MSIDVLGGKVKFLDALPAALPWESKYAERDKPHRIHEDSEEEIAKCINCTKAECDNCLAEFDKKYGNGRKIPIEDLRVFLSGNTVNDATVHFGCSRTTIWRLLNATKD